MKIWKEELQGALATTLVIKKISRVETEVTKI